MATPRVPAGRQKVVAHMRGDTRSRALHVERAGAHRRLPKCHRDHLVKLIFEKNHLHTPLPLTNDHLIIVPRTHSTPKRKDCAILHEAKAQSPNELAICRRQSHRRQPNAGCRLCDCTQFD